MVFRLCMTAESLQSKIRNIFPHISPRHFPCHWTKKILFLHQVSLILVGNFFFRSNGNPGFELLSLCSLPHYRYSFTLSLSASQICMVQQMIFGSPRSTSTSLLNYFPHRINVFVSFKPNWCHPHTQIRITLFHGVRISIPQQETFSQPCWNKIFFKLPSHDNPAKKWPYRFYSRRMTGFHTEPWFKSLVSW